jgi:hypothetical protein
MDVYEQPSAALDDRPTKLEPTVSADTVGLLAAPMTVVLWASAFVGIRAAAADLSPGPMALRGIGPSIQPLGRVPRTRDSTQRFYQETFATLDADTFRRIHHPEAVAIPPGGDVRRGVEPMMAAMTAHL